MQNTIHLLPDTVANQIAAGEVVQRPASVVKELLENAIDAGASEISLYVQEAGKKEILVLDNGSGMGEQDARMCFERHATSKITSADDLFQLSTKGFRGEAVASIAAVAHVELKTRRPEDEAGVLLRMEGGELKAQESCSQPAGTSVSVGNLFFNVPARRRFLKSNNVEMRHIHDEFVRVALAHPQLHFHFIREGEETYNLPPGKLAQRIVRIFGKNYREMLLPCEEATPLCQLKGYLGKPEAAKKKKDEQFFFVNGRFIRHPYLAHAIATAFEGLLPEGYHPFFVLNLEVDLARVDVNVHPSKTEVKFEDERTLYGIVQAAARKALNIHNLGGAIDFEAGDPMNHLDLGNAPSAQTQSRQQNGGPPPQQRRPNSPQTNWQVLFGSRINQWEQEQEAESPPSPSAAPEQKPEKTENKLFSLSQQPSADKPPQQFLQVYGKFLFTTLNQNLVVVDIQAARERILYEEYLEQLQKENTSSQRLLFPETLDMGREYSQLLMEIRPQLQALGFDYEQPAEGQILLTGLPANLPAGAEENLLQEFAEQYRSFETLLQLPHQELLARSLAVRTAAHLPGLLHPEECPALLGRLFACRTPGYAPDGRKAFRQVDFNQVGDVFLN